MSHSDIAKTILEQLGGNKFTVMTGARNFIARQPNANGYLGGLFFALPIGRANRVEVCLRHDDTYDVTFYRARSGKMKPLAHEQGVYVSDLRYVFTTHTGLEVSL